MAATRTRRSIRCCHGYMEPVTGKIMLPYNDAYMEKPLACVTAAISEVQFRLRLRRCMHASCCITLLSFLFFMATTAPLLFAIFTVIRSNDVPIPSHDDRISHKQNISELVAKHSQIKHSPLRIVSVNHSY